MAAAKEDPVPPPDKSSGSREETPLGIPKAPFIEDVEAYVAKADAPIQIVLQGFQETLGKYRLMEQHVLSRKQSLLGKIPEIEKSIDVLNMLERAEDSTSARVEMNDTLYLSVCVPKTPVVYLWLGANVMLEYSIPDGLQLLQSKLATAKTRLKRADEELLFLKDQITTMEVNTARVFNWDVKVGKRKEAAAAATAAVNA